MRSPRAYPSKVCPICEKEFTPWKVYQRYCTDCTKYRINEIRRLTRAEQKVKRDAERALELRKCPICKSEFIPVNGTQTYCKDCRVNRKDDIKLYLAELTKKKKKKKKPVVKSVMDICRDLDEYNRKHGTLLSYGKYVEKLNNGTLKPD